jgi:predicted outer membrane repeat protein
MSSVTGTKGKGLYRSEGGMVAIMVTMILIIVITLIVLGFAQIIRRNQRQALDHQLSTQAFYAAESGVNDVRKRIQVALENGETVVAKNSCGNSGGAVNTFYYTGPNQLQPDLDASANVKYVCVLVDAAPSELVYDTIGMTSTVVPLTSNSGANFETITLEWQAKDDPTPLVGCPTDIVDEFSSTGDWDCGYGVLRFDMVPTNSATMDINSLANDTMTSFAVPFASGGETAPIGFAAGTANGKNVFGASCTDARCTATINVASRNSNKFHLRLSSIYKGVGLKIRGTVTGGTAAELTGAQAAIDSTGKAQDITRRIKVTVPLRNSSNNALPDYALQSSDSICKRFAAMTNYYTADISIVSDPDNVMCTAP